jgi:hypothetical protein
MAGAPVKEETITIRVAVSKNVYAYLRLLRRRSVLGASENDIAKYLLTQCIEQMIKEKYHENQIVPPDSFARD